MTPVEQELFQAIVKMPREDAPRLAYADWLERHADPVRAEFIRLQVAIEKLRGFSPDWPNMARQEREFLERYQAVWERPLRQLLVPSLRQLGPWLKARIFGQGGSWGFCRGFVERILHSAAGFLEEDIQLVQATPIQQVLLTNASTALPVLANNPMFDSLASLHLVSDAEFDEDMGLLIEEAIESNLHVVEFHLPSLEQDLAGLLGALHGMSDQRLQQDTHLEDWNLWAKASADLRNRLRILAAQPRFIQHLTEPFPTSEPVLLHVQEWLYLDDLLKQAKVWAIAKSYHDLPSDDGKHRRVALFKTSALAPDRSRLRHSIYLYKDWTNFLV